MVGLGQILPTFFSFFFFFLIFIALGVTLLRALLQFHGCIPRLSADLDKTWDVW